MEKPKVGDEFVSIRDYGDIISGRRYSIDHTAYNNELYLMPDNIYWQWDHQKPTFEEIFRPVKEDLFDQLYKRMYGDN